MPQRNGEATAWRLQRWRAGGTGNQAVSPASLWPRKRGKRTQMDGEGRTQDQMGREDGLLAVTGAAAPLSQLT